MGTDEHLHVAPVLASIDRGVPLLIEKPLATNLVESADILARIEAAGIDAVVGYTQRFRRRWLAAKEKVRSGALGDVNRVVWPRNWLVAIDTRQRTNDAATISPLVISGTCAASIS